MHSGIYLLRVYNGICSTTYESWKCFLMDFLPTLQRVIDSTQIVLHSMIIAKYLSRMKLYIVELMRKKFGVNDQSDYSFLVNLGALDLKFTFLEFLIDFVAIFVYYMC